MLPKAGWLNINFIGVCAFTTSMNIMFPSPQKLCQLPEIPGDIWWSTETGRDKKVDFCLSGSDTEIQTLPVIHRPAIIQQTPLAPSQLAQLLCHYVVKKPLIFRLTQAQWVYRRKFHTQFGWKLITACYSSCFPPSRRVGGQNQMHCFYCLMLCAMSCNHENISTKIKLFLFQEYKRLSDSHKMLLVKMHPSRYRLNLLQIKILFSRFQLRTYFYNCFQWNVHFQI